MNTKCCEHCKNFRLWGTCVGYCVVIQDSTATFHESCESFEKVVVKRVDE